MATGWWDWTPHWSEKALDDAVAFWEPRYRQRDPNVKLTREDGREILTNLHGFFGLLARWDAEDKEKLKNASSPGNAPAASPVQASVPEPSSTGMRKAPARRRRPPRQDSAG